MDDTEPAELPAWLHQHLAANASASLSERAEQPLPLPVTFSAYVAAVLCYDTQCITDAPREQHNTAVFTAARALGQLIAKAVEIVDKRVVVNPGQARALLASVENQRPSGQRPKAFFGVMYYSALRPGEAANLRKSSLLIPEKGWGDLGPCALRSCSRIDVDR